MASWATYGDHALCFKGLNADRQEVGAGARGVPILTSSARGDRGGRRYFSFLFFKWAVFLPEKEAPRRGTAGKGARRPWQHAGSAPSPAPLTSALNGVHRPVQDVNCGTSLPGSQRMEGDVYVCGYYFAKTF